MDIAIICVFQNGNSQVNRIPSEMRTNIKEYFIRKVGDMFIVYPTDDPWAPARQVIGTFPEDFMVDRDQPTWDQVPPRDELDVFTRHKHLYLCPEKQLPCSFRKSFLVQSFYRSILL